MFVGMISAHLRQGNVFLDVVPIYPTRITDTMIILLCIQYNNIRVAFLGLFNLYHHGMHALVSCVVVLCFVSIRVEVKKTFLLTTHLELFIQIVLRSKFQVKGTGGK
jgi:hypothetical protein